MSAECPSLPWCLFKASCSNSKKKSAFPTLEVIGRGGLLCVRYVFSVLCFEMVRVLSLWCLFKVSFSNQKIRPQKGREVRRSSASRKCLYHFIGRVASNLKVMLSPLLGFLYRDPTAIKNRNYVRKKRVVWVCWVQSVLHFLDACLRHLAAIPNKQIRIEFCDPRGQRKGRTLCILCALAIFGCHDVFSPPGTASSP